MTRPGTLRPPKYRLHKASGQAVVTIAGRDYYLGAHGSPESQEKYQRLVGQWLQRAGAPPEPDPEARLTIVELVAAYLRFASDYYRKDGRRTNEFNTIRGALELVVDRYGRTPAADFGPLALKTVRQAMIEKGWRRSHINKQIDRVKRMFRWGVGEEIIGGGVYESLRAVPGLRRGRSDAREGEPVLPVAAAVLEATEQHLGPVVRDMVQLQLLTGARPGEICELRPQDIDRTGEVWIYRPESHKTQHHGRERLIYIGPLGQQLLLPYLIRPAEAYCFSPSESEAERRAAAHARRRTPLSCGNKPGSNRSSRPGRPPREKYDTSTYGRAIRRAAEKAGVEPWSPNQLRHAAATRVRKEFGVEGAQLMLGHATASVTQVYAERDFEKGIEIARRTG